MQKGRKDYTRRPRVVLVGGGTAGHLIPNLALVPDLTSAGFDLFYIGSTNPLDRELVGREGIPFQAISTGKFRRYWNVRLLFEWIFTLFAFMQSVLLLNKIQPNVVFSKGGFVSIPAVLAAWCLKIPVIIHESDFTPGLANRLCSYFAREVCVTHEITKCHFRHKTVTCTGLPIRRNLLEGRSEEGFRMCGLIHGKPVLLVIGGSAGSEKLNKTVRDSLDDLLKDFQVVHITGRGKSLDVYRSGYTQFEFASEIGHLYAIADLVVSRAGATTIAELLAVNKPAILVPLPRTASRGDQIETASFYERMGMSYVIEDEVLSRDKLLDAVEQVFRSRVTFQNAFRAVPIKNVSGQSWKLSNAKFAANE